MDLKFDPEEFDKYQAILIREIATAVKVKLQEAGLEGDKLMELTGDISFSVANIIDDMAAIESDGITVKPFLAFSVDDDALLHCGENSCTCQFVDKAMKKLFS